MKTSHWIIVLALLFPVSCNMAPPPPTAARVVEAVAEEPNVAAPLCERVAIYIPSTMQVSKSAEPLGEKICEEALVSFSSLFGGATAQKATGAYMAKEGLVKEQIKIVYSYTDQRTLHTKLANVLALERRLTSCSGHCAASPPPPLAAPSSNTSVPAVLEGANVAGYSACGSPLIEAGMSIATLEGPRAHQVTIVADDALYEIIDGQRVERPPMAILSIWIASLLQEYLAVYARQTKSGRALCEALIHLPDPVNRNRRPDVAFVSYERWGQTRLWPRAGNTWNVVPNLSVEVVSPTDGAEELQEKVEDYFRAGVQLVWVVYPLQSKVYVYSNPTAVHVLGINDQLGAEPVLPGFCLSLAELFAEPVEEALPTHRDAPV